MCPGQVWIMLFLTPQEARLCMSWMIWEPRPSSLPQVLSSAPRWPHDWLLLPQNEEPHWRSLSFQKVGNAAEKMGPCILETRTERSYCCDDTADAPAHTPLSPEARVFRGVFLRGMLRGPVMRFNGDYTDFTKKQKQSTQKPRVPGCFLPPVTVDWPSSGRHSKHASHCAVPHGAPLLSSTSVPGQLVVFHDSAHFRSPRVIPLMPLPWAYGHVWDWKVRWTEEPLGNTSARGQEHGVALVPPPARPRSTVHSAPPGSSQRRGKPCRRRPRCAPARPCTHAAAGDRLWFRVPAPQLWRRAGHSQFKRTATRQTHNLPEQFCSIDDDPKKHCHPVNCFTAFCVLSNISSWSKIEKNMEGREMSVSMVKNFSTNSICYLCI